MPDDNTKTDIPESDQNQDDQVDDPVIITESLDTSTLTNRSHKDNH